MDNNIQAGMKTIDFIEKNLYENLELSDIASAIGYSKYHLHRMFTNIAGITLHSYIQRWKLTEAARDLVFSDMPIIQIALKAGYETQQSFTAGFKPLYKSSPKAFRRKKEFFPFQLRLSADGKNCLRGDGLMEFEIITSNEIILAGYVENTKRGFHVIKKCWKMLNAVKYKITDRTDLNFLVGVNDYSEISYKDEHPSFNYYATVEVDNNDNISCKITTITLPSCKYAVFKFRGRNEEPLKNISDYIYKEWFAQSTYRLNENARYDFVKYGEKTDENNNSNIEYWVPII